MAIEKFTVSRDDSVYEAFPDVVLTPTRRLICVFSEMTHHTDRSYTCVMITKSDNRGRTWTPKECLSEPRKTLEDFGHNCPRIGMMPDGRIYALCDIGRKLENDQTENKIAIWFSSDNGESWTKPIYVLDGIGAGMPDRLLVLPSGRWVLGVQTRKPDGVLKQHVYLSDDQGVSWQKSIIYEDAELQLCEVSIVRLPDGTLAALMRENSWQGWDCYKSLSTDNGETWGSVHRMPIPACHRPVAGMLNSGRVMITHRFMPGGKGWVGYWTHNTFAALTDVDSMLATERSEQWSRIMPIDYDRSPISDTGYSGWVQYPDGEIYMVIYCLDDAPKAQIRGYSFRENDFILE